MSNYKAKVEKDELIDLLADVIDGAVLDGLSTYEEIREIMEKALNDNEDKGV